MTYVVREFTIDVRLAMDRIGFAITAIPMIRQSIATVALLFTSNFLRERHYVVLINST